jgi:AraC-like DNA-binding protein
MTENSIPSGEEEAIKSLRFSTESIKEKDQFDAWCEFAGSLSDYKPIAPPQSGFQAHVASYGIGPLQLCRFHLDPVVFNYTEEKIRKLGFDGWHLSILKSGKVNYSSCNGDSSHQGGSSVVFSYANQFSGVLSQADFTCLFFSRDHFWDIAQELDGAALQLIPGAMSHILREFATSIDNQVTSLTKGDVPAVHAAFSQLLRATFRQNADAYDAAKAPIAASQFSMARRFIAENLKSAELTADVICARLGISRRQLYYLFEKKGGVKRYITDRRLAACYNALKNGTERKLISSIAYEYGFTNLSSFYRQFHGRYGFRPSEARSAWLDGYRPRKTSTETFADWILRGSES